MNSHQSIVNTAFEMYKDGKDSEEITEQLLAQGHPKDVIDAALLEAKSHYHKKRRSKGLIFCGIGAALFFIAFLIVFTLHQMGLHSDLALYGLTSLGVGFLFTGMVFYMG